MITELTKEQEARFPEFIERWTKIGLCTDPANRTQAERAINMMYQFADKSPPGKIVWCGSPLSQGITRALTLDSKNRASVGDSVRDSVWTSVGASVGDSVGASVKDSAWTSVKDSVWTSVGASAWASVGASVWASVWDSVGASVGDSVGASVGDSVGDSVKDSVKDSVYGQHDSGWLAFYQFFQEVVSLEEQTKKLGGLWLLAESAGWALPHENICWVSERHNILNRDDRGRIHSTTEAAIAFPDGLSIYAVHGVRVPEFVIKRPAEITPLVIESERNAEIRRVMIDQYVGGQSKYLIDSGAKVVHSDDFGTLYRKEIEGDEPLVMVKVVNSTPEPDGSIRDYFLRCPPDITKARDAVAWTFNVPSKEYAPLVET